MKTLTRRRNIERATKYRVEYILYRHDANEVLVREFASTKSLEQWVDRNDNDNTLGILILKRRALIDDIWELYAVVGKKTITLSCLRGIIRDLEDEYSNSSKS